MMKQILTIPRFWGPLITIGFTVVYHFCAAYFGFTVVYGWLWLFLLAGSFIGGVRAGVLCAVWVSLYAAWTLPGDPSRVIQIAVISFAGAWLTGYLRRRERRLQQSMDVLFANGNVAKMREALAVATRLKQVGVGTEVLRGLELIENNIGNSLAIIDGYKFLREEIERVNEWYNNPANVRRAQWMHEVKDG